MLPLPHSRRHGGYRFHRANRANWYDGSNWRYGADRAYRQCYGSNRSHGADRANWANWANWYDGSNWRCGGYRTDRTHWSNRRHRRYRTDRTHWSNRRYGGYRTDRTHWSDRCHRRYRCGWFYRGNWRYFWISCLWRSISNWCAAACLYFRQLVYAAGTQYDPAFPKCHP